MNELRPKGYTQQKNLLSDWTDKKNYLFRCKMLIFYVKQGTKIDMIR